jgi:hypothetical protein
MCTQLCTHAGPPRGIHCALTTAGVYSCASNARPYMYLGTWGTCTLCTATGIKFCTRSESVRMFPWSFSAALPHQPHLVPLRPSEILLVAPHESSESTPSPGIQNPGSGKQYSSPGIPGQGVRSFARDGRIQCHRPDSVSQLHPWQRNGLQETRTRYPDQVSHTAQVLRCPLFRARVSRISL